MRSESRTPLRLGAALAVLLLSASASATPMSSDYTVTSITTPDVATGDVVAVGGAIFVGVGPFGAGSQSLVRIDGSGTTVLAEGFNALGGFVYDAANDRLIVGDNAGELPGALTGDTLYAIEDPFGSPGAPAAAQSLELLPAGSLPGYADVTLDPGDPSGDTLFVTDASEDFPPNGLLLEIAISSQTTSVLQSGLGFSAGLATDASTLYFGEVLLDFSGQVSTLPLAAPTSAPTLLAGLPSGQFGLELASDGSLLASSGGAIVRIDPSDGSTSDVATGFGFAAGLFAGANGVIYAIDGFAAPGDEDKVWVLTPIPEPGTGVLLAGGLALLVSGRRRRAARSAPGR